MQAFSKAAENLASSDFSSSSHHIVLNSYLLFSVPKAKVRKNLVGGTEFSYSFEKSFFSHKLFVTLSSVAISRQKGGCRVSKCISNIKYESMVQFDGV